MSIRAKALFTIGLASCCFVLANNENIVTSKFHSKHPRSLDPSDWVLATTTGGKYSVQLPCPLDDSTETEKDKTVQSIRCFYGDYKEFVVKKYQYKNFEEARQKFLMIQENYEFLFSVNKNTYQGNPSIVSSDTTPSECFYMQTIHVKFDVIFMLASDNETPECPNLDSMSRYFLNSLVVEKIPQGEK